ncbi:MAG: hypothetical protein RLZZ127_2946, partial [Planctomycetota bacterium]
MPDFDVIAHGAVADGTTDDAAAIQRAVDAAFQAGGGRVVVPAGRTVRAGSFELRSRVELHVEAGATLVSATNIEAFPSTVFGSGPEADKRMWISCRHAEQVSLTGAGTIDGQCHAFALGENEHIYGPTVRWRPAMTCFEDVVGMTVRGLTFRNAANWTLHFSGCEDVLVEDIRIDNDIRFPNADGIDPDHCRRVTIRRCSIRAGDDGIVLKNTAQYAKYGPCEDIDISDCRIESASAAFKIGSESVDAFRRVRMRDCTITGSNRALAIQLRDGGSVEDIEFRNITVGTKRFAPCWWGAGEAVYVTAVPRNPQTTVGTVRDVRFIDVTAQGENGIVLYAAVPGGIADIRLERVRVGIERTTAWPSGLFDVRPCPLGYAVPDAEPLGEDTPWGRPAMRAPAAVSIDGAAGVVMEQVTVALPTRPGETWIPVRGAGAIVGTGPRITGAAAG